MVGETREIAVPERKVFQSLEHMMNEKTISIEVEKGQHDGIILPTFISSSETWMWN